MTLRNTGRATAAAELVELDRGECLRLLGKSTVGRVVFTEGALPAAHPVTYLLDDEEVIFRTGAGSKLAAAARHHIVGFQADEIDSYTRIGWSVLGVGEAYEVVTPIRLAGLATRQPVPWIPDRSEMKQVVPTVANVSVIAALAT
jgi:nitroimidazol reductase NimA-like FMN-containing flavoprotein (pyridoxamine 5'-phosphate oxidase superfamily)